MSLKANFKAAKQSVQNKEYAKGLEYCVKILEQDSQNYNGLIFAGKCSAELNEQSKSRDFYIAAIEINQDQPLAFQGLANLFSKKWNHAKNTPEINEHQIDVFKKVLDITDSKNTSKQLELNYELFKAYHRNKNYLQCLELFQKCYDMFESETHQEVFCTVCKDVLKLQQMIDTEVLKENFKTLYKKFYKCLFSTTKEYEKLEKLLLSYLQFLFICKEEDLTELQSALSKMREDNRDQTLPIIVTLLTKLHCMESFLDLKNILELSEKLKDDDVDFYNLSLAMQQFNQNEWTEALLTFQSLKNRSIIAIPVHFYICQSLLKMGKFMDLRKEAKVGIKLCENFDSNVNKITPKNPFVVLSDKEKFKLKFSIFFANSLIKDADVSTVKLGIKTYQKLVNSNPNCIDLYHGLIEAAIKISDLNLAEENILKVMKIDESNMKSKTWKIYLSFKMNGDAETAVAELKVLINAGAALELATFLLAKVMWEHGGEFVKDKKLCFTALVKAAKINPYNDEIFMMLGKLYKEVLNDSSRAKGCFEKSMNINPFNMDVAMILANIYLSETEFGKAEVIYKGICDHSSIEKSSWSWQRLGLIRLENRDIKSAIKCFLNLLKHDSDDAVSWECLGQAYLMRGSYSAAWKAFNKSQELNPSSLYSLYQMAVVSIVTGDYDKAIVEFKNTLTVSQNYMPALKGLGESFYIKAKFLFTEGQYQLGIECIENSLKYLTKCCKENGRFSCVWKLIGDCCVLAAEVNDVSLAVPALLLGEEKEMKNINKDEALKLGVKVYTRALHLQEHNGALWHDLGVCYNKLADCKDMNESAEYAAKALSVLKMSVKQDPENFIHWNSLGVAALHKSINAKKLAQHCFIKSLDIEPNNAEAWVNLGVLYLSESNIELAHEAFKKAQSASPSLVNSWVGQAIIAETIGSHECVDLYRHSTELGLNNEAACGYASSILKLLVDKDSRKSSAFSDNIVNMNATNLAAVNLRKMSEKDSSNVWLHISNATLQEHLGLYITSADCYEKALALLQSELELSDPEVKSKILEKVSSTKINLIKVLSKCSRRDTIVTVMQGISVIDLKLEHVLSLAVSLCRAGFYVKSLELYTKAGSVIKDEQKKSVVMVAMSILYNKMNKIDQAKSLLYACFKNSALGLHTLSALAICQKDETLIGACMKELLKVNTLNNSHCDGSQLANICLLIATAAYVCSKQNIGLYYVQKAAHTFPNNHGVLRVLAMFLQSTHLKSSLSIHQISKLSYQHLNQSYQDHLLHLTGEDWSGRERHVEHVKSMETMTYMALCAGIMDIGKQNYSSFTHNAQRLHHMYPHLKSASLLLKISINVAEFANRYKNQPSNFTAIKPDYEDDLNHWINQFNYWNGVERELTEESNLLRCLGHIRDEGNTVSCAIVECFDKTESVTDLLHLGNVCKNNGLIEASLKCFQKAFDLSSNAETIFLCCLRMCHCALISVTQPKEEKWKNVLEENVRRLAELKPNSSYTCLMQGLAYKALNNLRKARAVLSRIVYGPNDANDYSFHLAIKSLKEVLVNRNDPEDLQKLEEFIATNQILVT